MYNEKKNNNNKHTDFIIYDLYFILYAKLYFDKIPMIISNRTSKYTII